MAMHIPPRVTSGVCRACGSDNVEKLYTHYFAHIGGASFINGYDVCVCLDCGFAFADNIPAQEEFNRYYAEMSRYTDPAHDSDAHKQCDDACVEMLREYVPQTDRYLVEVGCGTSPLLAHLHTFGYGDLLCVDPSETCAAYCRETLKLESTVATFDSLRLERKADCILALGVMEHIRDLQATIAKLNRNLTNNGLLMFGVPDASHFSVTDNPPYQEFSIEHINYFTEDSLSNIAALNGFTQTAVKRVHIIHRGWHLFVIWSKKLFVNNEQSREQITRYLDDSAKSINEVADKLQPYKSKPLIIWGLGTFTRCLLSAGKFAGFDIKAFIESDVNYQGKFVELEGRQIPIFAPTGVYSYPEDTHVLIASQYYQAQIENELRSTYERKNPVITLF
jgi:SAM-dependent methyltransferase